LKLQTKIHIAKQKNQLDYDSTVILLGSCFAQNIGDKIAYYKFKNLQNPFGIIFHPIGIEKLITRAIQGTLFVEDDIFLHNSQWLCFEGHSKLGKPDRESFLKFLNENLIELREYLISASHVILTFGTAWVYQHRASNKIVSNCHKIPQQEFSKKLLSVDEVSESINTSISLIRSVNPNAVIITTDWRGCINVSTVPKDCFIFRHMSCCLMKCVIIDFIKRIWCIPIQLRLL